MLRRHLTYANVMATIAVFIALGGASYAAIKLPANSVGNRQLRSSAVTLKKISKGARRSLKGAKGSRGATGPTGAQGLRGAAGDTGAVGPAGTDAVLNRTRIRWTIGTPTSSAADYTLERTTGSVTKRQDSSTLRITVQDTLRADGPATGHCLLQVRLDGTNDLGSGDVSNDTGSTGTEAGSGALDQDVPVTIVAQFRNVAAGTHTVQLYLANRGATSCVENAGTFAHTAIVEEMS